MAEQQYRIPNARNFQTIWDTLTQGDPSSGLSGLNPVAASGLMAQVYAESRANPGAINPDDGGPGSDSFGILQWNNSRRRNLENFVRARETDANDLRTQALYMLQEIQNDPYESAQAEYGLNAESPSESALAFAQNYVRPAAEHIPQRAGYGDMFYDVFANGADFEEGPMAVNYSDTGADLGGGRFAASEEALRQSGSDLGFDPSLDMDTSEAGMMMDAFDWRDDMLASQMSPAPDMSVMSEAPMMEPLSPFYEFDETLPGGSDIDMGPDAIGAVAGMGAEGSPDLGYSIPEQESFDIELMRALDPSIGPDWAAGDPNARARFMSEAPANPRSTGIGRFNNLGFEFDGIMQIDPATLSTKAISEAYGQGAGEEVDQTVAEVGRAEALSRGVPVETAPATAEEVVREVQSGPPDSRRGWDELTEEEKETRRQKYMLAADVLEALSVGLGQMGAGQPVNLGPVIQGQRQREIQNRELDMREEAAQQERAEKAAAQAQQAQTAEMLAGYFTDAGKPQLAALATSGPAGFKIASSAYEDMIATDNSRPSLAQQFSQLPPNEGIAAYMETYGVPEDVATGLYMDPSIGQKFIEDKLLGAENERGLEARANSLMQLAARQGLLQNPSVGVAMADMLASPNEENIQNFREAVENAGGELTAFGQMTPSGRNASVDAFMDMLPESRRSSMAGVAEQAKAGNEDAYNTLLEAATAGGVAGAEEGAKAEVENAENARIAETMLENGEFTPAEADIAKADPATAIELRKERKLAAVAEQEAERAQTSATIVSRAFPAEAAQLFGNVTSEEELAKRIQVAIKKYGYTEEIKTALQAANSPAARAALIELKSAEAGVQLTPMQQGMLDTELMKHEEAAKNIQNRKRLRAAAELAQQIIDSPSFEGGGPLTANVWAPVQSLLNDALGDNAPEIIGQDTEMGLRTIQALVGENFYFFRQEGAGASSDMESSLNISAMPTPQDGKMKQAVLAQRLIRQSVKDERAFELTQNYLLDENIPINDRLNNEKQREYVQEQLKKEGYDVLPLLDFSPRAEETYADRGFTTAEEYIDAFDNTKNLQPSTIVVARRPDGTSDYVRYRDLPTWMEEQGLL